MATKTKAVKTTPEQFAVFCESIRFYMDLLSLWEWKPFFYHSDEYAGDPLGEVFAVIHMNHSGRVADFTMRKTMPYPEIVAQLDPWLHGKHEVCELLLAELDRNCRFTFIGVDVDKWTHAVIRRLERALPNKEEA